MIKIPAGVKNIILDFGGVLFDIDYGAPARAFAALGIPDVDKIYSKAAQNEHFDLLEMGKIDEAEFCSRINAVAGTNFTDQEIVAAWNTILTGMPKVRATHLHELAKTYNLYLLSNTNAIHVAEFEKMIDAEMGIDWFKSAFQKVYYSNEMGLRKPHRAIFEQVAKAHNLVYEETLFIDDSAQHLVESADLGMHTYHFQVGKDDIRDLNA